MASTNKTTNYELSQFVGSDIPAWLSDYNGDMSKIDAGIHAAKVQADGAANGVSALQTTVSGKQDKLTFDTAPLAGSTNPVTSGGIYNALQNAQIATDAVPTEGSTKAVQSGGVYTALQGKQNALTFDSTPTEGSSNPVTSNGIYQALQGGAIAQYLASGGSWESTALITNDDIIKIGNLIIYGGGAGNPRVHNSNSAWNSISISGISRAWSPIGTLSGNPFALAISTNIEDAITNDKTASICYISGLDASVFYRTAAYCSAFYDGTKTCFYYSITAPSQPPAANSIIDMPLWAVVV